MKRYSGYAISQDDGVTPLVSNNETGEWVKYSDAMKLEAEIAFFKLLKEDAEDEIAELKEELRVKDRLLVRYREGYEEIFRVIHFNTGER